MCATAFIGGRLVGHGEEFLLAAGEPGPHRTHPLKHECLDVSADQKRVLPELADEPLYEEWDEEVQVWVKGKGA